jgi:multisubunit Na+/H+ antiporter MnhB subunit
MQVVQHETPARVEREHATAEETERLINVPSLSLAAIMAIVSIVVLTILSEVNAATKVGLTDFTGHHWVSKGLIAFAVFAVTWLASAWPLARQQDDIVAVRRWTLAAAGAALAGIVVIFLFFVGHFAAE